MPRRAVRESKFLHVVGETYEQPIHCENIDLSSNIWDGGNYCAVNSKFIAIVLEKCSFIVLPIEKNGKVEPEVLKVNGHVGKILDIQFNPFKANHVASAGEDAKIKIWNIPENGLTTDLNEPMIELVGHSKKVGIVKWHPSANNILASSGLDNELIIWDVEKGSPVHVLSLHIDTINCLTWNHNGSLIATTSKDTYTRIIDPRKQIVVHEFKAHEGGKPSRVCFIDESRLVTVGWKITAQREISLWDMSDLTTPITTHDLDSGSGNVLVMYDDLLSILYVAVKGDKNVRFFEISQESPYVHYLSEYTSNAPQFGFGVLPKHAVNVNRCEIFRLYKLNSNGLCEPISIIVPEKSREFQSDIYPDVPGDIPALTAEQWITGSDAYPKTFPIEDRFDSTVKEVTEVLNAKEDNDFHVDIQTTSNQEKELKKTFNQHQHNLKISKESSNDKELRIQNEELKLKEAAGNDIKQDDFNKGASKEDNISNKLNEESTSKNLTTTQITIKAAATEEYTKYISIKIFPEDYFISKNKDIVINSQNDVKEEQLNEELNKEKLNPNVIS